MRDQLSARAGPRLRAVLHRGKPGSAPKLRRDMPGFPQFENNSTALELDTPGLMHSYAWVTVPLNLNTNTVKILGQSIFPPSGGRQLKLQAAICSNSSKSATGFHEGCEQKITRIEE